MRDERDRSRLVGLLLAAGTALLAWVTLGGVGLGLAASGGGVGVLVTSIVALVCTPAVLLLAVFVSALSVVRRGRGPGAAAATGLLVAVVAATPAVLVVLANWP